MTKPRPLIIHFEFDQVEIFAGHIPPSKLHILFYGNRLATWHGFPDITHNFINSQGVKCIFLGEPGKWVQSFFLSVFMLYRYCSP